MRLLIFVSLLSIGCSAFTGAKLCTSNADCESAGKICTWPGGASMGVCHSVITPEMVRDPSTGIVLPVTRDPSTITYKDYEIETDMYDCYPTKKGKRGDCVIVVYSRTGYWPDGTVAGSDHRTPGKKPCRRGACLDFPNVRAEYPPCSD